MSNRVCSELMSGNTGDEVGARPNSLRLGDDWGSFLTVFSREYARMLTSTINPKTINQRIAFYFNLHEKLTVASGDAKCVLKLKKNKQFFPPM